MNTKETSPWRCDSLAAKCRPRQFWTMPVGSDVRKQGRNCSFHRGNIITVTDNTVRGTSIPISGDFRLEFDGEVTRYMPFNASPEEMKAALDSLNNIGHVSVTGIGSDVNRCYTWDITFVSRQISMRFSISLLIQATVEMVRSLKSSKFSMMQLEEHLA
eukprot:scaffold14825_cov20-Cyclotella_meneghiniana.AAC.9